MNGYMQDVTTMTTESLEAWEKNFREQPPTMDLMGEFCWAGAVRTELNYRRNPELREAAIRKNTLDRLENAHEHSIPGLIAFAKALGRPKIGIPPSWSALRPELTFDKQEIVGTIVSIKEGTNDYGPYTRMLLVTDEGNKLFGSVPTALAHEMWSSIPRRSMNNADERSTRIRRNMAKGLRVSFTALVEPKMDDPHFGFFKRPSKAKVI